MNSDRSFEFDRYPFDEVAASEHRADWLPIQQAYGEVDITHGMETGEEPPKPHFGDISPGQP
jgi:hypothetical protein